jgi:hypothetical protein
MDASRGTSGHAGTGLKSPAGFAVENPDLGVVKRALIEMHRRGKELDLHKRHGRKAEQTESAVSTILR